MSEKKFISGNDAFAEGIRLAKPNVISAYPITPQTIVVERLSDMVEDGSLDAEFIHVESEHSAMSCAMGAASVGARTFTATSSQGLLYMAECLPYAAGGRFPIVMMNADRSTALPWNIYGDQRDSISQLDSGWIQVYVENAQESLDMAIQAYYIAEHKKISNPIMVNLDGFILTHTYEAVEIPDSDKVDEFLPKYETENKMDLEHPTNMAFTVGPDGNTEFHLLHHKAMIHVSEVAREADEKFASIFGRSYGGVIEKYKSEDAEYCLITLGSVTGLAKQVVDDLRNKGIKAGLVKIRFMRPFPHKEITEAVANAKVIGVFERDISFGYEGTVYTNVNSGLVRNGVLKESYNFIGGLGGRDISYDHIVKCFDIMQNGKSGAKENEVKTDSTDDKVIWIGLGVEDDVR